MKYNWQIQIQNQLSRAINYLLTQVVIVPYEKEDPSHRGASKQFFNQNLCISKYESESDQKENWSHRGASQRFFNRKLFIGN